MTRHAATADSPLPFLEEDLVEVAEVDQLRAALADLLRHFDGPVVTVPPANRLRAWRTLAGRAAVPGTAEQTPEERRDEGIARAAARWTPEEVEAVDAAIRRIVVLRRAAVEEYGLDDPAALELTTADVWAVLDGAVPVTKGIAGRMLAAKAAGLIANTGRTTIAPKHAPGPNHGQRLTVWRAL